MSGDILQATVVISNPQGFHVRPAAAFVRRALLYPAAVTVRKGDRRVNGKSALDLLFLAAEQGTELVVEVAGTGPEAQAALEALAEILAAPAMDDDEMPPPKG